ncbi:MAG: sigma-70 family RNA polymerase sigma factor [Bacteroidota bacterium]
MQEDIRHIIQSHQARILKTCLGFTGDPEEAKDLAQEVLINIWLGKDSFKQKASVSTWIYRITVNTCLMYKRKRKEIYQSLSEVADEGVLPEHLKNDHKQDIQLLTKLIAELPEKDRIIMILYLENLTYEEISEVTGLNSNHIGVKINRIKQKLSKKFKAYGQS